MNGVGFDIGNYSCVVAEADHRGVHVVPNAESDYETPSMVSFSEEKRAFGTHAKTLFTSNPEATITDIKSMVGKKYSEIEKKWLLFPISEGLDGGILIHGSVNGNTGNACTYRPVQILAMLLAHLKKGAEQNMRGRWASECVIGIPAYFTDVERVAYLDATQIAGLKPKQLMHEGTAIALGYGYFRRSEIKSETNVVFVDVGHRSTQITIVKFNEGGLKVLSHAWDRNIGSQDFDIILLDYVYKKLKLVSDIDIYKAKPRSRARLISACEKTKKVLSTNTEAVLTIDSFMNGIDVSIPIKREEFENSIPSLLMKLEQVCHKAMKEAKLNIWDIKAVEVVGSGSRIPVVAETLTKYFGMELSRTLNSIECVARGCALQSTILVESSALNSYKVEDSYPFDIEYSSVNQKPWKLFLKGETFPITKEVKIAPKPIRLCLNPILNDKGEADEVRSFEISPSSGSTSGSPIVTLKISLDINGVLLVDLMQSRDGNKQSNSSQIEQNWNILEISTIGMTKALLSHAKEAEKKLLENDKLKEDTMRARNILESYIYNTREKVSTTYHNVITNSEKQRIESNLDELEGWINEEGELESKEKYEEKRKELEEMVDPIKSRYEKMKVDSNASVEIRSSKHEYSEANYGHTPKDIIEQDIVISDTHPRMALQTLVSVIQQELKTRHQYFATESEMKTISSLLEGIEEWLPTATSDEFKKRYQETCANLKKHWDPIMNRYDPEDDQAMKDLENTITETRENLYSFQNANRKTISEECDKIEMLGDEKFEIPRGPTLNSSAIKEKIVLEKMKQDKERKLSTASPFRISKRINLPLKLLRTNRREVQETQRLNCTNENSMTRSGNEMEKSARHGTTSPTQDFVISPRFNNSRGNKHEQRDSHWKKIKKVFMELSRKARSSSSSKRGTR